MSTISNAEIATRSTTARPAWSRFVAWLFSPPVGASITAPSSSVYGYPVSPVPSRTRRT